MYKFANPFACSPEVKEIVNDNLPEVAEVILKAYDCGELRNAIQNGHDDWQKWVKSVGKSLKRKVRDYMVSSLFVPIIQPFVQHSTITDDTIPLSNTFLN